MVSELFDSTAWEPIPEFNAETVTCHRGRSVDAVRVAFDRPDVLNAFGPQTVDELYAALEAARTDPDIGCVILTGNGPPADDDNWAFSAGGDQAVRGKTGYEYDDETQTSVGRLHILEVQRLIRFMPKPVVAAVPGWAVGGGHSLHVVCDLTIASEEHAKFKQTDPDVASFDGGFGSAYLARLVGQKRAREIFFLGKTYDAREAVEMGLANEAVPHEQLEERALEIARTITNKSPTSIRMLKYAMNLIDDGLIGQQVFAGEATRLAYMTDEAREGRDAFNEDRDPDYTSIPWHY